MRIFGSFIVAILVSFQWQSIAAQENPTRAVPWATSRMVGSPDPPLPYRSERVFEQVRLNHPTDLVWVPDANRWIATQLNGELVSFVNDPRHATTEPFLNLNDCHPRPISQALATQFHHDLSNQPWCFVTYSSNDPDSKGTHLARFRVTDPGTPKVDPDSRVVLASWSNSGHTGGSMQFGPDGMFYVSVGDGQPPYPPDEINTGQDLSDFESSILRIDVDDPTQEMPYRVPADNPFVDRQDARPEIWSYGYRNPWKIAFDPDSGDLLAADVGWEMRELVHRVTRGRNHGWSIMEGSQPVKQDEQPVDAITAPLFEHTHLDARSITGGYFWQSDRLPELKGAYIYGDWMTGKVWGLKHHGDRVLWHQELVDTSLQIICFMLDPNGEVLIVGYDGTILRLEENLQRDSAAEFPTRLSETGLFRDVELQLPAAGVVEYEISAHHWADGTHSRQWIAVPNDEQLALFDRDDWQTGQSAGRFIFPAGTVVAKTVSYFPDPSDSASERHLETQVLHLLGDEWQAYNYVWNERQSDAILQDDVATEQRLTIKDVSIPSGQRTQTWRHVSRSECLLCHIWAAGTVHAFWPEQLNIQTRFGNQISHLTSLGLFKEPVPEKMPIASPTDPTQSLEARARSYLAINCSTCHRNQGGGTANFNFDLANSLQANNYINEPPAQGTFGIADAKVIAPGDPLRSILLYRVLKSGRGHMPQFGSNVVDLQGVRLLQQWIASMSSDRAVQDPWSTQIAELAAAVDLDRRVDSFLMSPDGALSLSLALCDPSWDVPVRTRVLDKAMAHRETLIRDLFEHHLPEDQRVKRLGATIDSAALLAIEGSYERGKDLFERAKEVNCKLCHRIADVGQSVGPDLSGIGTQMTPAEILTSILRPADKIDARYRARKLLTIDGQVLVGIVTDESTEQVVLVDATGKSHAIAMDQIDVMEPSLTSVMPEQLLSGMTPQQAADLIAFLAGQRRIGPLQHKHTVIHRAVQPIEIDGRRGDAEWQNAEPIGDFVFTWWNEGDGDRQPTDARMLWDDRYLYVSFVCSDRDVGATRRERDSDVYRDDCVEVFASPEIDHPGNYFNLEMNAAGATLDNYRRDGKDPLTPWNPPGIRCAVVVNGTLNDSSDIDQNWTLEVAIPFVLFGHVLPNSRPVVGDRWRLNLHRLEDNMAVKSQWSQGDRNVPKFHTPDYFGFVEFSD